MDELKKYSPQYQHINDSLAFVVHLSFLSQNCKLVGLNEEQYLEDIGSIPQGWNKSNEIYQFRYILKGNKNKNKNKDEEEKQNENENKNKNTILLKILSMGDNQLLITSVKQGSNDVLTLEINLSDHIDIDKAKKDLNDYQSIYKDINGLNVLLNDQITFKAIPQKKANKEEQKNDKEKNKNNNPLIFPDPNNPNPNPLFIGGGRPNGGIPFGGGFGGDMDPFGGQGGNLMGPDQINQQWNNRRGGGGNNGGGNNGGNGGLPGVPPNARFDPFGPGGQEPDPDHFRPPRRGGNGNRRGGFGGGGFGGGGFGFGNGGFGGGII